MFMLSFIDPAIVLTDSFSRKMTTYCQNRNDNINMNSTIAGSMNDNINMDSTISGSMNACS
jgi:hypothetical protein